MGSHFQLGRQTTALLFCKVLFIVVCVVLLYYFVKRAVEPQHEKVTNSTNLSDEDSIFDSSERIGDEEKIFPEANFSVAVPTLQPTFAFSTPTVKENLTTTAEVTGTSIKSFPTQAVTSDEKNISEPISTVTFQVKPTGTTSPLTAPWRDSVFEENSTTEKIETDENIFSSSTSADSTVTSSQSLGPVSEENSITKTEFSENSNATDLTQSATTETKILFETKLNATTEIPIEFSESTLESTTSTEHKPTTEKSSTRYKLTSRKIPHAFFTIIDVKGFKTIKNFLTTPMTTSTKSSTYTETSDFEETRTTEVFQSSTTNIEDKSSSLSATFSSTEATSFTTITDLGDATVKFTSEVSVSPTTDDKESPESETEIYTETVQTDFSTTPDGLNERSSNTSDEIETTKVFSTLEISIEESSSTTSFITEGIEAPPTSSGENSTESETSTGNSDVFTTELRDDGTDSTEIEENSTSENTTSVFVDPDPETKDVFEGTKVIVEETTPVSEDSKRVSDETTPTPKDTTINSSVFLDPTDNITPAFQTTEGRSATEGSTTVPEDTTIIFEETAAAENVTEPTTNQETDHLTTMKELEKESPSTPQASSTPEPKEFFMETLETSIETDLPTLVPSKIITTLTTTVVPTSELPTKSKLSTTPTTSQTQKSSDDDYYEGWKDDKMNIDEENLKTLF